MKTALALLVLGSCLLGMPGRGGAGPSVSAGEGRSLAGKLLETPDAGTEWTPDAPHPTAPNVFASGERNQWKPAPGYRWLNPANASDLRVAALPFGGIGAALGASPVDGRPRVAEVLPGTPAEAAGLKVGMILIQIDAAPTAGKNLVECVRLIRGEAGTPVVLETYDEVLKTTHVFSIERRLIDPK